jgi:general secretion pathway protein A
MYERFYNLRERPFSLTPDPDYLYPSRFHRETLNYLRYGIEGHAGFVIITGEIGSGKTTLLQTALRGLDQQTAVARLVNTNLDARELIESVMLEFGLQPTPGQSKPYLLRELAGFLVAQRNAGRLALLVIDEAQNLPRAALEEVRMLSNIETEKSKLIQIIMVGQPSLRTVLGAPALEQLRQRVTVSYHLQPLDATETHAYVNHRIRRASIGVPLDFPEVASALLHKYSGGIPRTINVIADAVLLFGYADDRRTITPELAQEAIDELKDTGVVREPAATSVASDTTDAPAPSMAEPLFPISDAERDLQAREIRVIQREREVAEQRRVVTESLRLLRLEQAAAASRPKHVGWPQSAPPNGQTPAARERQGEHPGASGPSRPPSPGPSGTSRTSTAAGTSSRSPTRNAGAYGSQEARPGFWARLRRNMLNVGKPVILED